MRITGLLMLALCSGMCMLTSCWVVMPSCHKHFDTYCLPMLEGGVGVHPRTDGLYVCEEANDIFCFGPNGLVKT